VRVIAPSALRSWSGVHPDAAASLAGWLRVIEARDFAHFAELRMVWPNADQVEVRSGRTVTVFNIRGNRYRLLTALHYRGSRCYLLRFMSHEAYDLARWKDEL
jgi:mRNA interferase HigB